MLMGGSVAFWPLGGAVCVGGGVEVGQWVLTGCSVALRPLGGAVGCWWGAVGADASSGS